MRLAKRGAVRWRDLQPDEHAAVIGAVVAIVEQGDVPFGPDPVQELHQGARAFRELAAQDDLVAQGGRAAADHVADMQLRGLVGADVEHRVAEARQRSR